MRLTKRFITILMVLTVAFMASARTYADPYWIFFSDRGDMNVKRAVAAKAASSEPKSMSRRARLFGREAIYDEGDLPVNPDYIAEVARLTGGIRTVTRWFNGVSVDMDDDMRDTVAGLPFVREVKPVASFRKPEKPLLPAGKAAVTERAEAYSYGDSYEQLNMIGVPNLHTLGYAGEGITIAILDSGFEGLEHTAFDSLVVAGKHDFIDGDDNVSGDNHGTEVLSILAALDRGRMIGSAPHATYLLGRTEIVKTSIDQRIEEDYFVAGVEWADSLGADFINSSLGYTVFSDGTGYKYSDLDGDTAITTIAADAAAERGIFIFTSAGNEANDPWYYITTPADGDSVFAVGSVDRDRNVSAFSSRGPTPDGRIKPDFMALGENVLAVNTAGVNTYHYLTGTSYAAPALCGAAALLIEVNPTWDFGTLKSALIASAYNAGPDSLAGYGIPDVFAASGLELPEPTFSAFRVHDPFPQPITFSDTNRRIYFPVDIPVAGRTLTIRIFTFNGETVQKLESRIDETGELYDPGEAPSWDGTNFLGEDVAPGVYFYRIQLYGYSSHTGKIMVMR